MRSLFLSKIGVWLVLAAIVWASSWPLFNSEMFFTHDFVHGARIAEMSRAIRDGHFPVRWSSNFGYGYGMPLFEFYAPLPFYIGSLFYLLGLPLVLCVKLLFILTNILTVGGSYLLGRKLAGKWGGLLMAAVITLAPYRGLNLFIRGAVSETWGIVALIWVLYATIQVLEKKQYSQVLLLLSLVTLFLSHNLTVIIAAPFIAGWTLLWLYWSSLEEQKHKIVCVFQNYSMLFKRLVWIYLLAIGISSFYLLPVFLEKDFTKVAAATTGGYFNYQLHFLYIRQLFRTAWGYGGSDWGPDDKLPFFLGYGQYLSLALAGVAVFLGFWKGAVNGWWQHSTAQPTNKKYWFVLVAACIATAAALFMALSKSQPVWDALEFMKYIQFPWRYYSVMIVFVGVVAALSLRFFAKKYIAYLVLVVVVITMGVNWQYFRPERYLEDSSLLYYDDPQRVQSHMSSILPDYIPKQMPADLVPPKRLVSCATSDCNSLVFLTDKTQTKEFKIELTQPETIVVSIAQYPGWKARVNGTIAETKTAANGLLALDLPAGTHTVALYFGATTIRRLADILSGISSSILLVWLYRGWKKND